MGAGDQKGKNIFQEVKSEIKDTPDEKHDEHHLERVGKEWDQARFKDFM